MLEFMQNNAGPLTNALWEHIFLCVTALLCGLLVCTVFCVATHPYPKAQEKIIHLFSFFRLIPGIALLILFLPVFGVGVFPAVFSLTLITIPTILINLLSGIRNVPPQIRYAADSLGLSPWQSFLHIELPMAVPFLLLGIRTALVDLIAIATIASLMGSGGLGRFVLVGLSINNMSMALAGTALLTALALLSECLLSRLQSWYSIHYLGVQK
ncbi:MAG: ABC transporter permease [Oscillospiraceae bacterium]|nr:ABC transporter permease [Oscillospiraceae bacterium]